MRTGFPIMKTGFSLWEFPHRENPVQAPVLPCLGLQCGSRPGIWGFRKEDRRRNCPLRFENLITSLIYAIKNIMLLLWHTQLIWGQNRLKHSHQLCMPEYRHPFNLDFYIYQLVLVLVGSFPQLHFCHKRVAKYQTNIGKLKHENPILKIYKASA